MAVDPEPACLIEKLDHTAFFVRGLWQRGDPVPQLLVYITEDTAG